MALASSCVWEVRPGAGASTGGGAFDPMSGTPGTDYSQQNAAEVSWKAAGGTYINDLASVATTNVLTSAARATALGNTGGFQAADVGNLINITAGTHFTAGRYQIMSVDVNGNATLDRDCDDGSNATAGTGYLGGAVDLIQTINTLVRPGNTVYIKAGTNTLTDAVALVDGTIALPIAYIGYSTTRGDLTEGATSSTHAATGFLDTTNFPLIDGNTYFGLGAFSTIAGLHFSNTYAGVSVNGMSKVGVVLFRCRIANASTNASARCYSSGGGGRHLFCDCDFSLAGSSGVFAVSVTSAHTFFHACRMTNTNGCGIVAENAVVITNCLFYNFASSQIAISQLWDSPIMHVIHCTFYNIAGTCITIANEAHVSTMTLIANNLFTGCGKIFENLRAATSLGQLVAFNNRRRDNTNSYVGWYNTAIGDIVTDSDDATEYVNVAGLNFYPTAASLARSAATPPFGDIGALQREESSGTYVISVNSPNIVIQKEIVSY
jgi:hypothetical protein